MARTYGRNSEFPEKPLSGQAKLVFDTMASGEFLDPHAWAKLVEPGLKTRQTAYRVTLYYILIFKKRGLVDVMEQEKMPEPTGEERVVTPDGELVNDSALAEMMEIPE